MENRKEADLDKKNEALDKVQYKFKDIYDYFTNEELKQFKIEKKYWYSALRYLKNQFKGFIFKPCHKKESIKPILKKKTSYCEFDPNELDKNRKEINQNDSNF